MPSGNETGVTRNSTPSSEEEADNLLSIFSADKQPKYCLHEERCVTGKAPTLKDVSEKHGDSVTMRFLVGQLLDFADFVGCRNRMADSQFHGMARIIFVKYPFMKLTEFMLFLFDCKMGKYGRFYGTIEPMTVMANLTDFMNNERGRIIHAHDENEKRKVNASNGVAGKPITYEEYLRIKIKNGDFSGAFGEDARKLQAQLASNQPF